MNQEIKMIIELTIEADTELTNDYIEKMTKFWINGTKRGKFSIINVNILETKEESEIYGTKE